MVKTVECFIGGKKVVRKEAEYISNGKRQVPNITIDYKGYKIVPKRDFGNNDPDNAKGYVITDGRCNIMPGATWSSDVLGAKTMIDIFIEAKNDSDKFWELLRERQGLREWEDV